MKNLKSTKGFTLVELIVVIAILGILAAVAVPAYSGYLKKANEAGDTQLISAINTALQSAAAGAGKEAKDIINDNASLAITGGKVTIALDGSAATDTVKNDFSLYLKNAAGTSGVEVSGFKYYTKLKIASGLVTGTVS